MSESSSDTDDSDELAPSKIMEVYVAEQNVLDSFVERLVMKIKARLGDGLSQRQCGPRKTIRRDHAGAHQHLVEDYFTEQPLYPESMFRTRFRMNRDLFQRIVSVLGQWSPYFTYRAASHHCKSVRQPCACYIGSLRLMHMQSLYILIFLYDQPKASQLLV